MSRKEVREAATEPDRSKQGGVHPPFPFGFKEQEGASPCASSCYLAHLPPLPPKRALDQLPRTHLRPPPSMRPITSSATLDTREDGTHQSTILLGSPSHVFPCILSKRRAMCDFIALGLYTEPRLHPAHVVAHWWKKILYFFNVSQVTLLVLRAVPHNWSGAILKGALLSSNSVLFEYTSSLLGVWINKILVHLRHWEFHGLV